MKLHLGCGQKYLEGYINIDFPDTEHTLQKSSKADLITDITKLCYQHGVIDEIRLHHVFEHFRRPDAAALIATWNTWLKINGKIVLEVPDLKATAKIISNPFSSIKKRAIAERHIFGSHEAGWAAHYEGYSKELLSLLLVTFGFKVLNIRYGSWKGTRNIEIEAIKVVNIDTKENALNMANNYFNYFILPNSIDENLLVELWKQKFLLQLDYGWPN